MKRLLMILLCLALVLSLAACGGKSANAPAETSVPAEETAAPEETAAVEPEETSEGEEPVTDGAPAEEDASASNAAGAADASATDAEVVEPAALPDIEAATGLDEKQYAAAQSCVGRSVEELYEAVGMPTGGAEYAASCLEENAEDGMLHYDGFYVWTVRSDSGEVVHEVYLSQ